MSKRCYIAPVQGAVDTTKIAQLLSELLDNAATQQVFAEGKPQPVDWIASSRKAAQKLITQVSLREDAVFDGQCPAQLPGIDLLSVHAKVSAHLLAGMVQVLDATGLSKEQVTQTAHLGAHWADSLHATPVASIVLNADFAVSTAPGHTPVIAIAGDTPTLDDLAPLKAAVENLPELGMPPVTYQAQLVQRARADKRSIVLPESEDDRILKAAAELLKLEVVELKIIGKQQVVADRAAQLGLNLEQAQIVDPDNPELIERYAQKLAQLREKKGVTVEKAREMLKDSAYFGTMMIVCGDAHGMVSGAAHTTANTIRPALQLIKTKPGTKTVSGAFLMLFADHQDLYADCAVSINPNVEQLADIAKTSAATAQQFGIPAKVAMISYSTGDSGQGESVDKVKAATAMAKEANPDLLIDGPLQFDAAVDKTVAAKKLPGSPVAGDAHVFVFNHLDVGNCTYKAVQRTSGAVAVGPLLQGLNAPVNDLSRGALVEDIVNTVIITAVQAQG